MSNDERKTWVGVVRLTAESLLAAKAWPGEPAVPLALVPKERTPEQNDAFLQDCARAPVLFKNFIDTSNRLRDLEARVHRLAEVWRKPGSMIIVVDDGLAPVEHEIAKVVESVEGAGRC